LLFSAGDVAKQTHFIDEITSPQEQQIARAQLRQIMRYAENSACRRVELLAYFGETFPVSQCGACDNCLEPRDSYDGTIVAQKFLSCVYRVRQASRFGSGINHIIEILMGVDTEKIRRSGHEKLSTYGIGRDLSRTQWSSVGRELVRLNYLAVSEGEYATVELTPAGLDVLKSRLPISLTKSMDKPVARRAPRTGEVECDEILFERLRSLRKKLADERKVPAYIVFGDKTLRAMAREYPSTEGEMESIPGIGEKKRAEFGAIFANEIAAYLNSNSRMQFSVGASAGK